MCSGQMCPCPAIEFYKWGVRTGYELSIDPEKKFQDGPGAYKTFDRCVGDKDILMSLDSDFNVFPDDFR